MLNMMSRLAGDPRLDGASLEDVDDDVDDVVVAADGDEGYVNDVMGYRHVGRYAAVDAADCDG